MLCSSKTAIIDLKSSKVLKGPSPLILSNIVYFIHVNIVNIVQYFIHHCIDFILFRAIIPCVNNVNP